MHTPLGASLIRVLWLMLFTAVAAMPTGDALAKRKRGAAALPKPEKLPDINEVLTSAGWTITPEMSAAYSQPGDIFDGNNSLLKKGSDCFEAKVQEGAYASMEVNRSLEAGVRMRVMVGGVRADMGIEKKLIFDTPTHRQIPRLDLVPTDACLKSIQRAQSRGQDISDWYVVTDSLSAVVQKQECGSFDAKAGTFIVSGNAKVQQMCEQTSLEPVAVAYKLQRLIAVVGHSPTRAAAPVGASAPVTATTDVDFNTAGPRLGIADRLREQRCAQDGKKAGDRARETRISTAESEAQVKARAAWNRQSDELEQCVKLPRLDRSDCIAATEQWLELAKAMPVTIPAGIESIRTDCGAREIAFAAEARTIVADGVSKAESLLKQLKAQDVVTSTPPRSTNTTVPPRASVRGGIPCLEVVNMLNAGVPANIVASALKDAGGSPSKADIHCLAKNGAPESILAIARSMGGIEEQPVIPRSVQSTVERTASPAAVKDAIQHLRNNKPLTASLALYEFLKKDQYPEQDIKIKYYLARSLEKLEMYHSAQYFYLKVVNKGSDTPYFKYAMPKLVTMANHTGDDHELLKVVPTVPVKAYPRNSKNKMYYLMGLRAMYNLSDLSQARTYFGQISSKSDIYIRARYLEGIIYNKQGKLKSAKRAFMDVVRQPIEAEDLKGLERKQALKDLSLLNIGRMYYKIERYGDASKYFKLLPSDSPYFRKAVFSADWSSFLSNDLNETGQRFLALRTRLAKKEKKESKKRTKGKLPPRDYIPEWEYLRALRSFEQCKWDDSNRILLEFEGMSKPVQRELKTFVRGFATKEALKRADQAWDAYFGGKRVQTQIPQELLHKISKNRDIKGIQSHLDLIDREFNIIDQQEPEWRNTLGALLVLILEEDRKKVKRRAGKFMLAEMAGWANTLQDLISSSEILRFEVIDAKRVDYQHPFGCKSE